MCETLSYIFEDLGYKVETANSGKKAIDKIKEISFDAAIIDIRLPDMSGMDLLRDFKKIYPDMVCIIITGNATVENAINALEEGADGYFVKPTRMKEVIYKVQEALEKQRLRLELKESEEKYRLITENANDMIYILNTKLRYEYINENATYKITGYTKDDLIGKDSLKFAHPDDIKTFLNTGRMDWKKENTTFESRSRIKNGTYIWLEIKPTWFIDTDGKEKFLLISRDITKSKEEKQKLIESEEKYRLITENANDMIAILNNKLKFEYVNEQVHKEILGYEKDELIGKDALKFIIPDDIINMLNVARMDWKKAETTFEVRFRNKSGMNIWIQIKPKRFIDKDGKKKFLLISRDITKSKEGRQKLIESEEKFRKIFESIPDLFFLISEDTTILDYKGKSEDFYMPPEVFMGKRVLDIMPPEIGELNINAIKETIITRQPQTIEYSLPMKDGTRYYEARLSLFSENRVSIFIRDITERRQMEDKIKQDAEEWNRTFDAISDFVFIQDKNFNIIRVNKAFSSTLGLNTEEIIGKKCYEIIHKLKEPWDNCPFEMTRKDKKPHSEEVNDPNINCPQLVTTSPIFDKKGKFIGAVHISKDITELKQAEKELKVKDIAIASSINAIAIIDLEGKVTYVNNSALKLWGYANKKEMLGKYFKEFWSDEENFLDIFESLTSLGSWQGEFVAKRKDGKLIDVQVSTNSVKDEAGQPICIMGSFIDITERKLVVKELIKTKNSLAEQVIEKTWNLNEEKRLIESIINTISDGILVLNQEGKLSLTNNIVKKYYQEFFNEEIPNDFNFSTDSRNIFDESIKKLFLSDKPEPITIEPKEGTYLQLVSTRNRVQDQTSFGTIIEVRDVTQFIEFDNMRKKFVSTASHELRTPISVIAQSLHNVDKYKMKMSEEQQEMLMKIMLQNAELLVDLVNDLLTISRIDEKRVEFHFSKCQLLEILNDVLSQLEPQRSAKEISIEVNADETIEFFGDPSKIGQIFRIFIDNALKYSYDNSNIRVILIDHYEGEYNSKGTDGILIQFCDNGMGIHEKDIPHLFTRFFRSEDVKDLPGTGLGLAIAYELTRLHNGDIYVKSEYGKGSTFSVFLPRSKEVT